MLRRVAFMLLSCCVASALSAQAQQNVLVVSQNKCDFSKQERLQQMIDSVWQPIAQELVNEGKLVSYGSAYHHWGDEWNVLQWYVAPSIPVFLTTFDEIVKRLNQRHPTVFPYFLGACTEHKDSFMAMGRLTTPAAMPTRRE